MMDMKIRTLGKSNLKVSEVGLGCWQLGGDFGPISDAQAFSIFDQAIFHGVTLWDTADVYGDGRSESLIGRYLAQLPNDTVYPTVITKVGRDASLYPNGYTKDTVRKCLLASAKRLSVDCLDLVQLHCVPFSLLQSGDIFQWLEAFQQEGIIKQFGASVETVEEGLLCVEQPKLTSLQIIFNLFRQDAAYELLPLAEKNGVGIIARLPLASGLLSGKFGSKHVFDTTDHRNYNRDGAAFSVGETFSGIPFEKCISLVQLLQAELPSDVPLSQIAIRWILDHPAVSTVIAGVSKAGQIQSNVEAGKLAPLSSEMHAVIANFYTDQVRGYIRGAI